MKNMTARTLNDEICLYSFMRSIEALAMSDSEVESREIYQKNLKGYQNLDCLCLYLLKDNHWRCSFQHNTKQDYSREVLSQAYLFKFTKHGFASEGKFKDFDTIIPISYKTKIKAYILIRWQKSKNNSWIQEINYIKSLTNMLIIMNENRQIQELQKKREEYNYQMRLAKAIQDKLFHSDLPYTQNLKIFNSYIPHYAIGGDFYFYKLLNNHKIFL